MKSAFPCALFALLLLLSVTLSYQEAKSISPVKAFTSSIKQKQEKPDKPGKPDKPQKPEKPEKPERPERPSPAPTGKP